MWPFALLAIGTLAYLVTRPKPAPYAVALHLGAKPKIGDALEGPAYKFGTTESAGKIAVEVTALRNEMDGNMHIAEGVVFSEGPYKGQKAFLAYR